MGTKKIIPVVCPQCNAKLKLDSNIDKAFCLYCGTQILIHNENEHIYRQIDEAKIKEIETNKFLTIKKMEQEDKDLVNTIKIVVISFVLIAVVGIALVIFIPVSPDKNEVESNNSSLNNNSILNEKEEKSIWEDVKLKKILPEPDGKKGNIITNKEKELYINIKSQSKKQYGIYVEECIEKGFTIDLENDDNCFEAYNKEGYKLRLNYYESSKEFSIELDSPIEVTENAWPNSTLANMIPKPPKTKGKTEIDTSELFVYYAADILEKDFNNYVSKLKEKGFTIDYEKKDDYFRAKNKEGYEVSIELIGFNLMEIKLDVPEDINDKSTEETKKEETKKEEPKKEPVFYSTNDKDTVDAGNAGKYAYVKKGKNYDTYYIIDFSDKHVYYFLEGEENDWCDKLNIKSGNLKKGVVYVYHDGGATWNETLKFDNNNSEKVIMIDGRKQTWNGYEATNLDNALKLLKNKTITQR